MAKSKEQKREEARMRQNAHSWQRVDIPLDMPFLAGGYTKTDWDCLVRGNMSDDEIEALDYMWESCETLEEQHDYFKDQLLSTKPYWA